MIQASGATAQDTWRSISEVCDNVSRLDLQTTVWTILERPHLAKAIHEEIKRGTVGIIPIRNACYIEGHPQGETVNLNKRSSDTSARVYDKAAESNMGAPRSVWRYEVEFHRRSARAAVAALRSTHHPLAASGKIVHDWFTRRGIVPIYAKPEHTSTLELTVGKLRGDTLRWFRDTLRKTVANQVRLHGRAVVLDALGLANQDDLN